MTENTENTEKVQLTVDVVCIRGGNEVLLIERGWPPYKGRLALPGGYVDPDDENRRAAAVRELREETGVRVAAEDLIRVGTFDAPGRDPRGRYITRAYLVTVPSGTTAKADTDAAAVQWVPMAAVLADRAENLAFDHHAIVTAAWRKSITH
ncbi:NUDIX hydrolase [Streptomyces sp. 4503]|uniref:NUDIX hydrolase n=1 Tax=Streptomyces niphimycinicus TaxID=2842201 RepID=A0ABS6CF44_9ACTN|nr:NUDIX hydrolase [Streptomyces niphimycinicus]MBU3865552.1 NUDIX hydrolase [Streptomyces niphimycinicus]